MAMEEKIPVLIVDDRVENLASLEALLGDLGLELVRATSGNEALRQTLYSDFALVLLDVQMPEMDGFETAELLRGNARTRRIPIIFVTAGMKEERHQFKGYETGAVDYLMKPIEPAVLRSKVRVFCQLYRQRRELELQEQRLEGVVAERTAELSRSAAQLRESKERYQRLLESITSYVYTVTVANGVPVHTAHSAACHSVTGFTPEEFQADGELWSRITPDEDRQRLREATELLFLEKRAVTLEQRIRHKDGSLRWISNTLVPTLGGDGVLSSYEGVVVDITERKRLEEQLAQSQKMESIGRLAGGVAHEFNNMLSVIIGSAELLKQQVAEADAGRGYLEHILKAARRSSEITRQLLAFSRKEIASPRPVDLNALVAESQKMISLFIGEDVRLSFHPAEGLWSVKIDPMQVDQILMNLAANARDAMPEGGSLVIELANIRIGEDYSHYHLDASPGDYVQLAVTDTGVGMEQEVRERIFEPFFTTKKVGKGTGLGLATLYGIVSQNNGFVHVYSEPGHGTTFRICLPRSLEGAVAEAAATAAAPAGHGTILLVEDEEMLLQVASRQLEGLGYRVIKAATPVEAISLYQSAGAEIDLVLTDVVMPQMSGRELIERLREISPEVKALFMSGYTAEFVVQRGVVEQGVQYIQKPLDLNLLHQKIREILKQDWADRGAPEREPGRHPGS
jgi:two-component system, cell cycle sensor histidine kinase and response regulator CckA